MAHKTKWSSGQWRLYWTLHMWKLKDVGPKERHRYLTGLLNTCTWPARKDGQFINGYWKEL